MKEYTKTNPVYSPKIQIVETTDPAHADNVNAAPKQLLENTMANRQSIERLEATTGIAEGDYNEGNAYHTGDFCLYDNNLYKCIKDTTGAWDAGSWKETSPLEEIESLRKSLDALDTLMGGATQSKEGTAGLVPAPAAGAHGKYLRGDGTWQTPPDTNTTYGAATQSAAGLMSAADKKKLDGFKGIANNDTTTEAGFAWDAIRGKALRDDVDALNSALTGMKKLNFAIRGFPGFTIPNNCRYSVEPTRGNALFATIQEFATCSNAFSIVGSGSDFYIIGASGTTVSGLIVKFWYLD